jgi:hypothetical protein
MEGAVVNDASKLTKADLEQFTGTEHRNDVSGPPPVALRSHGASLFDQRCRLPRLCGLLAPLLGPGFASFFLCGLAAGYFFYATLHHLHHLHNIRSSRVPFQLASQKVGDPRCPSLVS